MATTAYTKWRFNPEWRITTLALLLFVIMINLGFWQLDRAGEKHDLQIAFERKAAGPYVPLSDINYLEHPVAPFTKVMLEGEYEPEKTFLIENKVMHGRLGMDVITVFRNSANGQKVLVNRGWIARDNLALLPVIPATKSTEKLSGHVYVMMEKSYGSDKYVMPEGWPKVIPLQDIDRMILAIGEPLPAFIIRLDASDESGFVREWPTVNMAPEKHMAYAIQWFSMSFALVIIYLFASISLDRVSKYSRQDS